jgi:protein arginine N-methyltransferase 1
MHLYSIHGFGDMIADTLRTDAYAEAIRRAVKPGCVVLDMGTGAGIWALLACRAGARKVYAIDKNDAIVLAREIAAANGYADRIEFIQELSTRVSLPERADVVVTEMHGILPMFEQNLRSIIDARRRMLVPGGTIIPRRESLWAAVVDAPELHRRHTHPWDDRRYGLDLRAGIRLMSHTWLRGRVLPEQLLVKPECWATLDYLELDSPDVAGSVTWSVARPGTGHGLIVWFETDVVDGVRLANAPDAPELIFGSAFFPWPAAVALAAGDLVTVDLQADLVNEDYVYRWNTRVLDRGGRGELKADFRQSTFFAIPRSPDELRKQAASHRPVLNEEGQIDREIFLLMDGTVSLEEIARRIQEAHPARFPSRREALARVGTLSRIYSR